MIHKLHIGDVPRSVCTLATYVDVNSNAMSVKERL